MSGECPKCHEHCLDCQCKVIGKYKEVQCDLGFLQPGTKKYKRGVLTILISPPFAKSGWHMSISTGYRDPIWEEIRDAWYDLVPDADERNAAMFFPPKDEYVNLQKYCFHLHEFPLDIKMSF